MTEAWSQWEGQIVNDEFHLQKYLGGSDQSAVFLTERRGRETQPAAIKLIQADAAKAELQLQQWELAKRLSHPHLIQLLQTGRCRMKATELVFVVMEYAEENLAQILPERRLTAAEARTMLEPTLEALTYLHGQGLVHGRLKPANIMAARDQVKLTSESVCKAGEPFPDSGKPSAYDPPERASGAASPAADVWWLGMTLAEVLTQHLPWWKTEQGEPVLPEGLPAPFFDIVRGCLRPHPSDRWTIAEIAARLHPTTPLPQERKPVSSQEKSPKRRFVLPGVIAAVAVIAILTMPGVLRRQPEVRQNIPPATSEHKPAPVEAGQPAQRSRASNQPGPARRMKPSPTPPASEAPVTMTRPATTGGAVVYHGLPDVPQSALDTIQGTVRVRVRVQVDRSGNVVGSAFDSPGPSKYFARLAMDAAQSWRFVPTGQDDKREFILRFEFRESGTTASATPAVP